MMVWFPIENELVQANSDKLIFSRFIIIIDIPIRYCIEIYPSWSAAKLNKIRFSATFPISFLITLINSFIADKAMYK